jgi:hypothetical protein
MNIACLFGLHNYDFQYPNVAMQVTHGYAYVGVTVLCSRCGKTRQHQDYLPGLPIIEPDHAAPR